MELAKMEQLKHYSENELYKKLKSSFNGLSESFLTENLQTKKSIKEKIDRIINCSTRQIIHKSKITGIVDTTDGTIRENKNIPEKTNLYFGNSCNQYLLCPVCARKHADILKAKYHDKIKSESQKYKYAYMITFTLENQLSFNDGYDLLQESIRNFRRQGQKRNNGKSRGESGKILSGIGCGEVKEGEKSKKWHIHNHFIVFTNEKLDYSVYDPEKKQSIILQYKRELNRYPTKDELRPAVKNFVTVNDKIRPVSKLSYEWYKATGGRGINIDCRPLETKTKNVSDAVNEVIKYASKINELPEYKLLEILVNKDKKRFFTTWGTMRKKTEESEGETVKDTEELLTVDYMDSIVYNYSSGKYTRDGLTERDNEIVLELYAKREKLKEYRAKINKARVLNNRLMDDLKRLVILHGLSDEKNNLKVIFEVDSLRKAYKTYLEYIFRHTVNIPKLRNRRLDKKLLNKKEQFYYNIFNRTLKFIPEKKCRKWSFQSAPNVKMLGEK